MKCTLLEKKVQHGTLFVPYLEPSGKKGSQKGSLHVQEPKKVPYITKNDSKEPKKVLKMVLKAHLEPFSEPLKVPACGTAKEPLRVLSQNELSAIFDILKVRAPS